MTKAPQISSLSQKFVTTVFLLCTAFIPQIQAESLANTNASDSRVIIALGVIENATKTELTNVQVIHRPTGAIVGFSPVLPGKRAELGLPPRKLMADIAVISWVQLGEKHLVTLDIPKQSTDGSNGEMMLLYTVLPSGKVTAELRGK